MTSTSKWTAFLLSACVPGTGQLAAGSWSSLAWFVAAGLLAATVGWIGQSGNGQFWLATLPVLFGLVLCAASAEHAKRLLEKRNRRSAVVGSRVTFGTRQRRNVDVVIALDVAQSPGELWQTVRDLPRFLTIDPFHDEVTLLHEPAAVGTDLKLSHNAFGRRFLRFGQIMAWREGTGYTFSDLSPRGPDVGFPHVFIVEIQPRDGLPPGTPAARLSIRVRGRWTSPIMPVWCGRWWVWLVCREHARLLRKGL